MIGVFGKPNQKQASSTFSYIRKQR